MDETKSYGTTMRIDISPEMLRDLRPAARGEVKPGNDLSGVIRLSARKPVPPPAPSRGDFQSLLQSLYDALLLATPEGRVVGANERAERFFATPRDTLCGMNVLDLMLGADSSLLGTILSSLDKRSFVLIQAVCPRADRSAFPAEIAVARIPLSEGIRLGFFVRDITVRKENEERLKTGYNALQNSGSGIAIAALDGTLSGYINPAMLSLLRLESPEQAAATSFYSFLVHPETADEIRDALSRAAPWEGELDMKRPDGSLFFAQTSLEPNINPDGETTGIVVSLLDVTPQRQAQIELAATARELRQRNAEMESDLTMARDVQLAFLPSSYPDVSSPGGSLRFAHLYHPSGLVGGDFFDIIPLAPSQVLVFMADVMGHGPRAALIVATIRGLIEQIARETSDPGRFMTRLNTAYFRVFGAAGDLMFATALCCRLDLAAGTLTTCHAGHPLPVLRAPDGAIRRDVLSDDAFGPAIGLLPDTPYASATRPFLPGERLLFFTDGLTETRDSRDREFGEEGLLASFRGNAQKPLAELLPAVVASATQFTGSGEFEDDVCILGVDYLPTQPKDPQ